MTNICEHGLCENNVLFNVGTRHEVKRMCEEHLILKLRKFINKKEKGIYYLKGKKKLKYKEKVKTKCSICWRKGLMNGDDQILCLLHARLYLKNEK